MKLTALLLASALSLYTFDNNVPQLYNYCPEQTTNEARVNKLFFGCEFDKIQEGKTLVNGRQIDKDEAIELIQKGELPKDSNWLVVTVLAKTPQQLETVKQSIDNIKHREGIIFNYYDATNETYDSLIKNSGFVHPKDITIYIETPDGKVLHRQDDFNGGAAALDKAIEKANGEWRQPRADYDGNKDPDLRQSNILDLLKGLPPWSWLLLIAGVLLLIKEK